MAVEEGRDPLRASGPQELNFLGLHKNRSLQTLCFFASWTKGHLTPWRCKDISKFTPNAPHHSIRAGNDDYFIISPVLHENCPGQVGYGDTGSSCPTDFHWISVKRSATALTILVPHKRSSDKDEVPQQLARASSSRLLFTPLIITHFCNI